VAANFSKKKSTRQMFPNSVHLFHVDRHKLTVQNIYLLFYLWTQQKMFLSVSTTDLIANAQTYEIHTVLLPVCVSALVIKLICRFMSQVWC